MWNNFPAIKLIEMNCLPCKNMCMQGTYNTYNVYQNKKSRNYKVRTRSNLKQSNRHLSSALWFVPGKKISQIIKWNF